MTNPNKKQAIVIGVAVVAAVALIAAAAVGYFTFFADDGLILDNVYVADVNIGGKTPEEAKVLIQRQTDLTYPYEDMVVRFPDEDLHLTPSDTGVTLDIDKIVEDAYHYGRSGTWAENRATREAAASTRLHLELGDYLSVDTAYIQSRLDAYEEAHTSEYADSSVTVEGERPALDAENYSEENPCQTLVIYTGNPGRTINMDGILDRIMEAYGANEFLVTADVHPEETIPAVIDLDPLYTEHAAEPVDAAFANNGGEITITPETYGYDFDKEAAVNLLAEAEFDQTLEIPFRYLAPDVLTKDLEGQQSGGEGGNNGGSTLFRDVLGKYTTYFSSGSNRGANIKLAAKFINGKVLMPGEKFDYNTTVGKRTEARGFKPAASYVGGKTVDSVGGGICQVSSTLYYTALLADMRINTRTAHGFVSSYMPLGMDATVSWGGPHFAFTNNTDYPIRIEAWTSGGALTVRIVGTNTKSYKVKMEYEVLSTTNSTTEYQEMTAKEAKAAGYYDGQVIQTAYTGKKVVTYRCKYDLATGKLISREYEATSNYKARNKIIVKIVEAVTEKPTDPPTTPPTDPPTNPPTNPPTDPPTTPPTNPPTDPPTTPPTDPPTQPPTEAPTDPPTTPPTDPPPLPPTEEATTGEE